MNAKAILARILSDLPTNRDWLDPALEAMAREAVKEVPPVVEPNAGVHTLKPEQVERLPKWAQEAFKCLERERFCMARELKEWNDNQTPGPVSIQEYVCTGNQQSPESVTRYVQTQRLRIEWKGCRLDIHLTDNGPQHEDAIDLKWGPTNPHTRSLALVPYSFQAARLIVPENLIRQPKDEPTSALS